MWWEKRKRHVYARLSLCPTRTRYASLNNAQNAKEMFEKEGNSGLRPGLWKEVHPKKKKKDRDKEKGNKMIDSPH